MRTPAAALLPPLVLPTHHPPVHASAPSVRLSCGGLFEKIVWPSYLEEPALHGLGVLVASHEGFVLLLLLLLMVVVVVWVLSLWWLLGWCVMVVVVVVVVVVEYV
jgi:hypothetical protein